MKTPRCEQQQCRNGRVPIKVYSCVPAVLHLQSRRPIATAMVACPHCHPARHRADMRWLVPALAGDPRPEAV